jgi:hypothetical protein
MDSQVSFLLFSPLVWLTTASFGEPCSYTREASGGLRVVCGWLAVWISRKAPHNYYSLIACLRGPDLQMREQQVYTMLRSARFPFG